MVSPFIIDMRVHQNTYVVYMINKGPVHTTQYFFKSNACIVKKREPKKLSEIIQKLCACVVEPSTLYIFREVLYTRQLLSEKYITKNLRMLGCIFFFDNNKKGKKGSAFLLPLFCRSDYVNQRMLQKAHSVAKYNQILCQSLSQFSFKK